MKHYGNTTRSRTLPKAIAKPVNAEVLEHSTVADSILLTSDKDFGELVYRQKLNSAGVVLLRLAGLSPSRKAEIVAACFQSHATEFAGAFTVASPSGLRIRRPHIQ